MTSLIFLDTGYLLALVNERDQYHQQALELSRIYEPAVFLTTDAVLMELGNALSRSYKAQAIEFIDYLMQDDSVVLVRLTSELFADAFFRYRHYQDQQWGLVDCLSFVVMERYGVIQVLSFDRHFAQAGFQMLMP